ncbi:hypothetical protein Fmac_024829 [Flemingia macrophylla]|uniref:Uncharacterized protein n=1 Tax=Flemingia macrophylla TaxID=520843 RepID=A0ABD1LQH1_9FABA
MMPFSLEEFTTWLQIHLLKLESARNDAIVIRRVHDVATDTSTETRKVEGKIDALVNLVIQLAVNQKPASARCSCEIPGLNEHPEAYAANIYASPPQGVHDVSTDTSTETRKVEGKLDALVNLVIQLAVNQKPASIARVCGIRSSNDQHTNFLTPSSFSARNDAIVIRGVNDVATDTSTETRKVEGKLYPLVKMVTQLAVNQKPASAARVFGIRSSNDHHTNVCPSSFSTRNDAIVIRGVHDVATDTSAETRKVEGKLDALVNARNDVIVIRGVHDVSTDTSAKTRKVEGKLDALVNLATTAAEARHLIEKMVEDKLAVNQKPDSIARVCGIRSSNDHHTNVRVHDEATDRSAETRKVEGKLDALINLVTQLAVNQKPASVARVYGNRSSNDHHTKVCPSSQKPGVNEHPKAYAANNYSVHNVATDTSAETRKVEGKLDALLKLQAGVNEHPEAYTANIYRVNDMATDTSAETRKVEGKLDALVNLVTQLAQPGVNEHPEAYTQTSIAGHHKARGRTLDREDGFQLLAFRKVEGKQDSLVNLVTQLAVNQKPASIARATTAAEAKHLIEKMASKNVEGKLDALVNLVTQLAVNQKPASVARRSGVNEHPEAYAANIYSSARNDVATYTSTETRKVEGKLDALLNLVTQLAMNQKPASNARVCGIYHHSSKGQTLDREDGFQLLAISVQEMMPLSLVEFITWLHIHLLKLERGVHDVATNTFAETRKVEGKLDALVNLVTLLDVNQKSSSVTRVYGIRSSNDHHTNVTHLVVSHKPASVARVCGICSSIDHHTNVCPSSFNARNDVIVIRGVHDVATDTSAETRKVEGKLDARVNLVTQLAQTGVNEHPEASTANIYSRPPQQQRPDT